MLEEWAPVDENVICAEEDAVGELAAATDETSILPSIPEAQEDQGGQDVIDNLSTAKFYNGRSRKTSRLHRPQKLWTVTLMTMLMRRLMKALTELRRLRRCQ